MKRESCSEYNRESNWITGLDEEILIFYYSFPLSYGASRRHGQTDGATLREGAQEAREQDFWTSLTKWVLSQSPFG